MNDECSLLLMIICIHNLIKMKKGRKIGHEIEKSWKPAQLVGAPLSRQLIYVLSPVFLHLLDEVMIVQLYLVHNKSPQNLVANPSIKNTFKKLVT